MDFDETMTADERKAEIIALRNTIQALSKEIKEQAVISSHAESLLDWLMYTPYPECGLAIIDLREGSSTEGEILDDNEIMALYLKYKNDFLAELQDELTKLLDDHN